MFMTWLVIELCHKWKASPMILRHFTDPYHPIYDMSLIGGALTHLISLILEMKTKLF